MKYYTGVGSRNTPQEVLDIMILIGEYLAKGEYCLRSGGAAGADKAFETGCDNANGNKRIYVPWNGFQGNIFWNSLESKINIDFLPFRESCNFNHVFF